ncbi:serine hydrolase domain-containing protein [Marinicella sp. W31]|uniref:serine hydrolase domain-containing protein n=1 Tax=Marinicella sp. W31 TaxID=3023713 RepID=UPI0037565886
MKKVSVIIMHLLLSLGASAQNPVDTLTAQLTKISDASSLPGFAVAIVSQDQVLYTKGFGYADVASKKAFTENTSQNIGSITKTLIAFSLMKLVEEGTIKLDAPINQYLPFSIHNPHFPNVPITVRQLVTHTSSLTDGLDDMLIEKSYLFKTKPDYKAEQLPEGYAAYFDIYKTNESMSIEEFLINTYCPSGDWYETQNFLKQEPGENYHYSNIGATLLAFVIEQVAGQSFSDYTSKFILKPLKMNDSYWHYSQVPSGDMASLYMSNGLLISPYTLVTYPDGGLITSIADFAVYLQEMIKGINGNSHLLKQASFKEMMSNQLTQVHFPQGQFETSKGMMWYVNPEGDNISMNGADPGVSTYTLFTTAGNMGIAIFVNTSLYDNEAHEDSFRAIRGALLQNAGKLLKQQEKESAG